MLSFIGEAATSMMYQVEGTPKAFPHFLLPRKWKVCFSALMRARIADSFQTDVNREFKRQLRILVRLKFSFNQVLP
jgi:hypothetical protein